MSTVAFTQSDGNFIITDSVAGITYSSNTPLQFNASGGSVQVVSNNFATIGTYLLANISSIGGAATAGTVAGAIIQLNALFTSTTSQTELATAIRQDTGNTTLSTISTRLVPQDTFGSSDNLSAALNSQVLYTNTYGMSSIAFRLVVPTGSTVVFEGSFDGSNYDSVTLRRISNDGYVQSTTISDRFIGSISGMRLFRVRVSVAGSAVGTAMGTTSMQVSTLEGIENGAPSDFETNISEGKIEGYSLVNKFGRNPDVDTGSVPEDIYNNGGAYTGFPTGSPEEFQVFSSSASDTGVLTFTYLASNTATAWQTATVTLQGTTPVNTAIVGYRMHTANYASGSSTGFNIGNITVRHRTTTANIFCFMPIGTSQTYVSAYTVPAGSTGYIRRLFCRVYSNTTGQVSGALWVRALNGSPRIRRPFSASNDGYFEEQPYGGLIMSSGSDIIVRIVATTASNLDVIGGYDLILVRN